MARPTNRTEFKDYFVDNKYTKWYFDIVNKAIIRDWSKKTAPCYVENHHIIPRSFDSSLVRDKNNIVSLTAREHYVCHLVLTKAVKDQYKDKMLIAIHRIANGNPHTYVKSSHLYEKLKIQISNACSVRNKKYWNSLTSEERSFIRSGEKNSMYGKNHTDEVKRTISRKNKGRLAKEKHPLWGVGHSEETKIKCSVNAARYSAGKKWYHDPISRQQKYFIEGQQPDGWLKGRGTSYGKTQ